MSTALYILCFISTCSITPDNKLFTVNYAFNHETLIILRLKFYKYHTHLVTWKLCVAVARHNFKWLKI